MFSFIISLVLSAEAAPDTRKGTKGSYSCPGSYIPITGLKSPCPLEVPECRVALEHCKAAADLYGTWDSTQDASWEKGRPDGCFLADNGKVYFNYKYSGGNYFGDDTRICTKNPRILERNSNAIFKDWPTMALDVDKYMDENQVFMSRGKWQGMRFDGWSSEADKAFNWKTDPGMMLTGWTSLYRGFYDDRVFRFHQAKFPGSGKHADEVATSGWCNIIDAQGYTAVGPECSCQPGKGIVGITTDHKVHNDRRWKIKCASLQNMRISPWEDDHIETGITDNNGNDVNVQCPQGTVVCGIESKSEWVRDGPAGDANGRDRGWKLKCCKAWVYDPAECAAYDVTVDDFKISKPPKSKSIVVDSLSASNCGSATPVDFKINRKRSITRSVEESMELSESLEETFATAQSDTSKFNWNSKTTNTHHVHHKVHGSVSASAFGVKAEAGFETGYQYTNEKEKSKGGEIANMMQDEWSSKTTRGKKQMTKIREETQTTFSADYSYSMPAGSRVSLKARSTEYRGTLHWWGEAKCYNAAGNLLETKRVSGKYNGALIGDTSVVVDTNACPEDGWKLHDSRYCAKGDWLKDGAGKIVTADTKKQALDKCEMTGNCECVLDRGCKNQDAADDKGNYVLCQTGCRTRLEASKLSCTFSYMDPICDCKHSGGGPLANTIKCSDNTEYSCGAAKTCSSNYASGKSKDFGYALADDLTIENCPEGFHPIEAIDMPCHLTNGGCLEAKERCLTASDNLGYDFVNEVAEDDEALFYPSGCFMYSDGKVRFNHKKAGIHSGDSNYRVVCATNFLTKPQFCNNGVCNFENSAICEDTGCFKVNKTLTAVTKTPPAMNWKNWAKDEPNNADLGDEDCVTLDPLNGEWKSENCRANLRSDLICGARTGGDFEVIAREDWVSAHGFFWASHEHATKACYKRGLTLPNIRDRADNEELLRLAEGQTIWIGLNDGIEEGKFNWDTVALPLKYANWRTCGYTPGGAWKSYNQKYSATNVDVKTYTLADAKTACDANPRCKAITCTASCTLRGSEVLTNSPNANEVTYQRTGCGNVEGRSYTVEDVLGKCLTTDGRDPKHAFHMSTGAAECRRLCSGRTDCEGYSVSSFKNCLLWLEKNLKSGGENWGGARCNIKTQQIVGADQLAGPENQCALMSYITDHYEHSTKCHDAYGASIMLDSFALYDDIQCPDGQVMTEWVMKLGTCSGIQRQIQYKCADAIIESTSTQYSQCGLMKGTTINFLDRTMPECPGREVMTGFRMVGCPGEDTHRRFKVQCAAVRLAMNDKSAQHFDWTECQIANKELVYIDRQHVKCPANTALRAWRFHNTDCAANQQRVLMSCTQFAVKNKWEAKKCDESIASKVVCGLDECKWSRFKNRAAKRHVYDPPSFWDVAEAKQKCQDHKDCGAITCQADKCSLRMLDTDEPLSASDNYEVTHSLQCRGQYVEVNGGKSAYTHAEARAVCAQSGLPLATATTVAALKELQKVGDQTKSSWIGLTSHKGHWVWDAPIAERLRWSMWAKDHPKNDQHRENCVMVYADTFTWNDLACDWNLNSPVLCSMRDGNHPVEYHLSSEAKNFNYYEAKAYCEKKGMTLATMLSEAENKMANRVGKDSFTQGMMFWIGMTDEKQENTFVWDTLDSRTVLDVATPKECQNICADDYLCNFYNWTKKEGKKHGLCQLMEAVTNAASPVEKKGTVTGPGKCPNGRRRFEEEMSLRGMLRQ